MILKKPIKDLPPNYVPPGGQPFVVSGSAPKWNWESVAAHHKLPDVWKDLIEFNFPTVAHEKSLHDKCAATNWYLGERLKCVNKTADGKSYRFEGALNGTIYIPKAVTNDVGIQAARSVVTILRDPHLRSLDFVFGDVFLHSDFFERVREAILGGKMGIAVNKEGMAKGAEAEYDYTSAPPLFCLRYPVMLTPVQKSAVVHEAVHAISHLKGRDRESLLDEAVAYLTQAMYHRRLTGQRITDVGDKNHDFIYQAADEVAQLVLKGRPFGDAEVLKLRRAVQKVYDLETYRYSGYPIPK